MLKALRLPWRPTTTAARCNYLKNARRSPIPPPPPPPPPGGGGAGDGRAGRGGEGEERGGRVQSDAKVAGVDFCARVPRYDRCHRHRRRAIEPRAAIGRHASGNREEGTSGGGGGAAGPVSSSVTAARRKQSPSPRLPTSRVSL
jgi:hypothetical protein